MKLISNDEVESNDDVDKLQLNNDEFDKEKNWGMYGIMVVTSLLNVWYHLIIIIVFQSDIVRHCVINASLITNHQYAFSMSEYLKVIW